MIHPSWHPGLRLTNNNSFLIAPTFSQSTEVININLKSTKNFQLAFSQKKQKPLNIPKSEFWTNVILRNF